MYGRIIPTRAAFSLSVRVSCIVFHPIETVLKNPGRGFFPYLLGLVANSLFQFLWDAEEN